ncbi:MAG: cellulase family glycosylhydrolase [Bacteroidetes bacterium]|nr:cellulase family glycosylhydrolase [Bacteroidota bacterium]
MKTFKKILKFVSIAIAIVVPLIYVYLFTDSPYPSIDEKGLVTTESENIPAAQAILVSGDSIAKNIQVNNGWFKDPAGRTMILHGINLGGSSKLPFQPNIPSHQKDKFYETVHTVSFIGRPFPLSEADAHFQRLHQWGYRFVRLLVTWEAIEHAGPGKYDEDYLNYIQAIVKKAGAHHINVFIDPHQDVWSRFSGGDGAPYWTFEKVGLDPLKFNEAGAAILHNVEGDPFPKMIWPTNYSKLAAATMFTLFFGGNDFAPHVKIDSLSAQDYLQTHYINAIKQVALKLKGLPNVIGFDTFNEPSVGYIGIENLASYSLLTNGVTPNYFEGMVAGAGNSVEVREFEFGATGPKEKRKVQINPNKISVWKEADTDIWKNAGVWGYDAQQKPVLLKADYFGVRDGKKVDYATHYFKPFVIKYQEAIHQVDSSWVVFVEAALMKELPKFSAEESKQMVNAGHWYDAITLLTKEYSSWIGLDVKRAKPVFGKTAVRETFHGTMKGFKDETLETMGKQPTLVGEFGIPFDMGNKKSFSNNDFRDQEDCLDRSFRAMESNQLNYTLWNYTADNNNTHGDNWNGEDLSIFSTSQQKNKSDVNSGGRALAAALRAYPFKVAGEPLEYFFNKDEQEFYLKFKSDKITSHPTEIFLPEFHYGKGFEVQHTAGKLSFDKKNSLLLFVPDSEGEQRIRIIAKQ